MNYARVMRRYRGSGPMPYYTEMPGTPGESHGGTLYAAWQWFRYCCRNYVGTVRLCRVDGTVLAVRE